jgi:AcrR family transcriptional regulator
MEEVARKAKVGRATLYLHFAGRDALITAVVDAELTRYLAGIQAAVDTHDDPDERLVHGFAAAYRLLRHHAALTTVLRVNPDILLPYLIAEKSRALELARAVVESLIRPDDMPTDVRAPFAEHIARVIHSLILIPVGVVDIDLPEGPENYARRFLLPVKEHLRSDTARR